MSNETMNRHIKTLQFVTVVQAVLALVFGL